MTDGRATFDLLSGARACARRLSAQGADTRELETALDSAIGAARYDAMGQSEVHRYPGSNVHRPLPTNILRPGGITSVAAGITTNLVSIQWPKEGICVGIGCGTLENSAASLGAMSVRITKDGTSDIFGDGLAGAYAHFATTFSPNNGNGQSGWWPCALPFSQSSVWQAYFRNESAAGPYTPVLQFAYVALAQ